MPKLIIKKDDLLISSAFIPSDVIAFTVGTDHGNDIIIGDKDVSIFHLQFEKQGQKYYVRDLLSQKGTFVNGDKLSSRVVVENLDEIGIGSHKIIFLDTNSNLELNYKRKKYDNAKSIFKERFEDRIANVPSLKNLNSWLNEANETLNANKIGDVKKTQNFEKESEYASEIATKMQTDESFIPDKVKNKENVATASIDSEKLQQQNGTTAYLLGIYGPYLGKKFKLNHTKTRIGRDRKHNNIVISKNSKGEIDKSISRRHATITYKNHEYYVTDKRSISISRTYVNRKKLDVNDEVLILPKDELEIVSEHKNYIFRMVPDGDWDFSFPQKAGAWYVRYRMAFLNVFSAILVMIAVIFLINTQNKITVISYKPNPLTVKEEIWFSDETNLKTSITNYGSAIADINGDKFLDLVFIDGEGYLKSVNGKTREILWANYNFQASPLNSITLDDLNNNGKPDVVVVSNDLRLRAIDGNWGIEIWKSPILTGLLIGPPAVGDFNGDGLKDIAIASSQNVIYFGFTGLSKIQWIKLSCNEPLRSVAAAEDVTGNGIPNIIIGTETGKLLIIDGVQKTILREIDIKEELYKASGRIIQNAQIRFPVALGDLNGDETSDLIATTVQGNVIAFSGKAFETLWYDDIGTFSNFDLALGQPISLGDLDGDNQLDVVIVTSAGKLRALKGLDRDEDSKIALWEYPDPQQGNFLGSPVIADFNKNRTMDVLAIDRDGKFYIFEGSTGELLWKSPEKSFSIQSSPLIGDLNRDNYLDILALRSDGNFYKLTTNRSILKSAVVWDQPFSNSRLNNNVLYRAPKVSRYYLYLSGSLSAIVGVIGLNVLMRKKRKALASK